MTTAYLQETSLLDFSHNSIQQLISDKHWRALPTQDAIAAVYNFVRDDILFGYNADDNIPASQVLADGYGQCNTKSTLFMALLRALGIPCRLHGFSIFNALQRGAIPAYLMPLAPKRILHSWVEVQLADKWLDIEGFIIDQPFLRQVQQTFGDCGGFSGYGIAVTCLQKPQNEFNGGHTYIQAEGIADDFGLFTQPDEFYAKYGSNLRGLKKLLYRYMLRHLINCNVKRIRRLGIQKPAQKLLGL